MQYVTRLLRVLIVSCLANYWLVCIAVVPLSGLSAGIVLLALLVGYLVINIRPCRAPGATRRLRTLPDARYRQLSGHAGTHGSGEGNPERKAARGKRGRVRGD